jgi:H+/gluconate symporter-like permease
MLTDKGFIVLANADLKGANVTVKRNSPELTPAQKAEIAAIAHNSQGAMTILSILGIVGTIILCVQYPKWQRKYEEKKAKIYANAQADEQRKFVNNLSKEFSSQPSQSNSVESKLSELKGLLQKGMINQEEYDAKRKKIIESL